MKIRHLITLIAALCGVFAVSAATQTKQELFDTSVGSKNTEGQTLSFVIANAVPTTALTVNGGVATSAQPGRSLVAPVQYSSVIGRHLDGPLANTAPEASTYAAGIGCAAIVGFTWLRRTRKQA